MFFVRPSNLEPPAILGPVPASTAVAIWPVPFWAPAIQPQNWDAIYRLAYEQGLAAVAPSAFQRMLEPSMN
jgi:hypothetical protein